MNGTELAQALHEGRRVYGTCVISPAPQWPRMIAQTGLDFVFLDTEHIALDNSQLAWMCQTYAGLGLAPIVRIPAPDPYRACQVLDGGATGVIAPYLESVAEVRQLRGAVKLRPLKGARLAEALAGETELEPTLRDYLADYNRQNLCIVNIESIPALNALDDMLQVADIDALLIGPHDLSINLGIPEQYHHPRFEKAVRTVIEKGRAAGVGVGMHFSDGIDKWEAWAKAGMNLILHSSDVRLVGDALSRDLAQLRQTLGDPPRQPVSGKQDNATVDV